jgi:hypothetical protein
MLTRNTGRKTSRANVIWDRRRSENIKMDQQKQRVNKWTWLNWLRIRFNSGDLWTRDFLIRRITINVRWRTLHHEGCYKTRLDVSLTQSTNWPLKHTNTNTDKASYDWQQSSAKGCFVMTVCRMIVVHPASCPYDTKNYIHGVQWTQHNSEPGWPLQIHTWEGGEDREAIAHTER